MKRLFCIALCLVCVWLSLDNHYPSVAVGSAVALGVVVAPLTTLRKRASTRTTKPGVRSAREKSA